MIDRVRFPAENIARGVNVNVSELFSKCPKCYLFNKAKCWGRGEACKQARLRHRRWQQRQDENPRRGAESDEESDGCNGAQDSARVQLYGYATQTKPQGFISRPPLQTTNKVL